jgi:hypothetical protein
VRLSRKKAGVLQHGHKRAPDPVVVVAEQRPGRARYPSPMVMVSVREEGRAGSKMNKGMR